jgi:phospholipid/cholesterol/gamma-HCH transport system permease protein
MKTREEVDALKVMGIEPMQVLVVPRVIALVITLPLLTFFADIMGLVGGASIAQSLLEISPLQYLTRLRQAVDGSDLFVGLFKAPIFAFFIAIIGCMGLEVGGSAVVEFSARARFFLILFEKIGI